MWEQGSAAVAFTGVWKFFAGQPGSPPIPVLHDVSLSVRDREFVSILGPSGCGKSTLLNLCAGLLFPDRGTVSFRGTTLAKLNTRVSYVTQDANLLPWRTAIENVSLPLKIRGLPRSERDRVAAGWLDRVGLHGFEHHYPHQLSGGMQKRCSIARTLAYDPDVILMDEPFGPLDAITRLVLQDNLLHLWQERQKTILFVTHDLTEAIALSDRVVVMSRRPARVKAVVDIPLPRPRDVFHVAEMPTFAAIHKALWDIVRGEVEESNTVATSG